MVVMRLEVFRLGTPQIVVTGGCFAALGRLAGLSWLPSIIVGGADSSAVGRRIKEGRRHGAQVAFTALRRHGSTGREPGPETGLREEDILVIYGLPDALEYAETVLLTG
jgi:TrkA-C domain